MKKQVHFLIIFFVGGFSCLSAQNLLINLLPDSSRYVKIQNGVVDGTDFAFKFYKYDAYDRLQEDILKTYYDDVRNVYVYDAQNHLTQKETYRFDPLGNWELNSKITYEYDAQGRNTFQMTVSFVGNQPDQTFFYFDDATHRDSSKLQVWNVTTQSWKTWTTKYNQYRPDGKIAAHQQYNFKTSTGMLEKVVDDTYRYYPDGKLRYRANFFSYNNLYQRIDSFIYNAQGKLDSFFFDYSSNSGSTFLHTIQNYQYDANGKQIGIYGVELNAVTGNWIPFRKYIVQEGDGYYSNERALEEAFLYNTAQQVFYPYSKLIREFTPTDPNHVLYHRNYTQGNTAYDSLTWYRIPTVATHQPAIKEADCQFANPLPDGSYITCDAPELNTPLQVSLQDAFGRVVQSQAVMPGEPWMPYPGIVNGVYFMSVRQKGAFLGAKRVVIARE